MKIDCNIHAATYSRTERSFGHTKQPSNDALGLVGAYRFKYSYPLSTPAVFLHTLVGTNSARDLLELGRKDYEAIYAAEDNPGKVPGMLNRASSTGPYGIWGHEFSDLYFEGITIDGFDVEFCMGS